jgi:type IV secretion system protein VirB4
MVGHVSDKVVLLDDGSVLAMFSVAGIAWETADVEDIRRRHEEWNNTLRNVASDTLIINTYQCRGMADPSIYPDRFFASSFADKLNRDYRRNLFERSLYNNRIYIAVMLRPARYAGEMLGEQIAKRSKPADEAPEDRLRHLEDVCELLRAKLQSYGLRRIGVEDRGLGIFSEIAEALVFAMTGIWRPIGLCNGRMANAMFSERIIVGREAIEIRTPGWSSYAAMFSMREYPASTWPGMFDALSVAPYRCTVFQSFRFLGKATADSIMTRKQNFMVGAEDKAFEQLGQLRQAGNDLLSNKWVLGQHSLSVIAFADDMRALTNVATVAWRDLADSGAVAAREGAALEAAFFAMLPGNERLQPRPGYISSRNLAAMAPLHNFPAGPAKGHWGAPIAVLRTAAGTPYRFHWHVGDVGSTLITGETGSGKTLLASFLMAMTAGRARIFALDYKRGWELMIRALGGKYGVLGDGQPHLAPLKALPNTPKVLRFLNELIRACIGKDLTDEEDRRLSLGLRIVMALPSADRSLGEVCAFLGQRTGGAGAALARWCWGNDLGWVIDAPVNTVDLDGDIHGYDLTAILDDPRARGAALATLFFYIEQQLDGRRVMIASDEGWKALLDPDFRPMIERRVRTIRSLEGIFVFLTQGPEELAKSDIGSVLVAQCPTQIRLPVDRANKADYVNVLKSTEGEWQAFRALRKGSGMFLVCQGGASVVAELPLAGMDDAITILSARQTTLNKLDAITAQEADVPIERVLDVVNHGTRQIEEVIS